MEVLLLIDIVGIGRKNDLVVVKNGFALNCLLPERKAIVATPGVRKRFAEHIKKRALEREMEREIVQSVSNALGGKVIHISAKASKTGKLYAALSEQHIVDTLASEYGISVPVSAITLEDHIKTVGLHPVTVAVGAQSTTIQVDVKAAVEKEKEKEKAETK
ncbi:MAG: 50S ribosomal protein L9 [Candidatus Peribacteraceae bacterium]|nr:50S ribosomal protein L9 [Candidatus Peribacteraceae bacterium]